jgi:DNA-directed RNA polymerase I, II, and III subunit RPABC1
MDYKEKSTLFKIRKTLLEMLEDRGYEITDELKSINFQHFIAMYDSNNINFCIDNLYIHYFNYIKSFSKSDLKNIVSDIKEEKGESINIIIIIKDKIPSATKTELEKPEYSNVEIFNNNELIFNITKNYLVPQHILLTEEGKKEIYKKYSMSDNSKFQQILVTDPVAKYYAMKVGDLCKIIRPSPSAGIGISYRAVRNA